MTNFTGFLNFTPLPYGKVYIEDICKSYTTNLNDAYLKIAIFNVVFYIIYPFLEKYKDKRIIAFPTSEGKEPYVIRIEHIQIVLFDSAFLLNFFVVGYWLIRTYYSVISGWWFV